MALNENDGGVKIIGVGGVEINHSELNVALSEKVIELNDQRRELLAGHKKNVLLDADRIRDEGRTCEVLRSIIADAKALVAKAEAQP